MTGENSGVHWRSSPRLFKIVTAAKRARDDIWKDTQDVGQADRLASRVTTTWQRKVVEIIGETPEECCEVEVAPDLGERIDVVDRAEDTAYELKVTRNNPQHEYFKDVFKVLAFNQEGGGSISRFVFLTDARAAKRLRLGLGGYAARCGQLGLELIIVGLTDAELAEMQRTSGEPR